MPQLLEPEREKRQPAGMPEQATDRRDFQRTLGIVTGIHIFILLLFFVVAKFQRPPRIEQIVWLDGGLLGSGGVATPESAEPSPPLPEAQPEPEPEPELPPVPEPEPEVQRPPVEELALPKATPLPETPKPTTPKPSTPKPTTPRPATPNPQTPKPATPKPATTATPKPKPKTTPKPQPSPAAKPKSTPTSEPAKTADNQAAGAKSSTPSPGRGNAPGAAAAAGKGKGNAGKGPAAGAPSDFGEYASRLRDKYYAVWVPPSVPDANSLIVTLKIRVKRDGTVLGHELVKSSGNSLMDGSVMAAAQQVTEIPPLPDGFGRGNIIDIPINFKPE